MTSYLFVVRVPVEKDLPKENDKEKLVKENEKEKPTDESESKPVISETNGEPKPKAAEPEAEESAPSTSSNKESSASDKDVKPDLEPQNAPTESVSDAVGDGVNTGDVVKKEEEDAGNEATEPDKTLESSDTPDVEWDFGDETTEESASVSDKNVPSEDDIDKKDGHDSGENVETIKPVTPEVDFIDAGWDLTDETREVTAIDKNGTPDKVERLLPVNDPNNKEEDKISLSRFTVEPSSDVETVGSDAEKEKPDLKSAMSSESINSKKFVVDTISTPVVKDLNENKLPTEEISPKLDAVVEAPKEKPNATLPETSMPDAKPVGDSTGILKSKSTKKLEEEEKKAEVVFFIPKEPLVKVNLYLKNSGLFRCSL